MKNKYQTTCIVYIKRQIDIGQYKFRIKKYLCKCLLQNVKIIFLLNYQ